MDIHIAKVRAQLAIRKPPHWRVIRQGCAIGVRRNKTGQDTWVGRYRLDGIRRFISFGRTSSLTWAQVLRAAEIWWAECERGLQTSNLTVAEACHLYVENRRIEKGNATANDANKRFTAQVYRHPIAKKQLRKLSTADVEAWRNAMAAKSTKCAANRNLRSLKAALNYSRRQRLVSSDDAWSLVGMFSGADGKRELYLTKEQRQSFISACQPWLAALLTGLAYSGARPGELRQARVADVDLNAKTLRLTTRKGNGGRSRTRHFPLSNPAAFAFFERQTKGKLPGTPLFLSSSGGFIGESVLSSTVRKVRLKRASELGPVVAYTFRHCAISDWLIAGIPVASVASMCGTSIEKINDNYFKFVQTDLEDRLAAVSLL